ncbi:MAG TPA: amidohydrolase family protein [Jatrophihabitans sp.]|jgi:L-fuconolactonase
MTSSHRIDAHHHVWDLAVRDQAWTAELPVLHRSYLFGELLPELDAAAIDRTVLVQTISIAQETPEFLALAAAEPRIGGVVGWVDLTGADMADRIAELSGLPGGDRLVAIRHQVQGESDPRWLCRADVRRGLHDVSEADLAYDLLVLPHQLPAAIETVRALPECRFVLDHAAKPPIAAGEIEPWRSYVTELAGCENVAVKLSGLITEADLDRWTVDELRPFADVLLSSFGAERIMFGSDWPVCLLAGSYQQVLDTAEILVAGLSQSERAAVFGGTAARWYRLEV